MADTSLPTLPKFPTVFGEEEEKRLQEVEKQKTQMEEVYKTKFTPEAWAGMSKAEVGLRRGLAGTVFAPSLTLAPWEWGFDYGLTPEEAQERLVETQSEYEELLRMQRVVTLLPSIQNSLRALALTPDKLVTTREDMNKYFKLGELGFTDEEQNYLVAFAQSLIHQSPEDIISGQIWGLNPITPEEIAQLADEEARSKITPSQLLSTVAFSESMSDIQDALQNAYPPEAGTLTGEELDEAYAEWLRNYLESMGVGVGDITFPELWEQYKTKTGIYAPGGIAEQMEGKYGIEGAPTGYLMSLDETTGEPIVNPDTGEPIIYTLDADNFAWDKDKNLMGYYDSTRNIIAPVDADGNPLITEYQQEAAIKDIGQAARISLMHIPYMGEQYFLNTIPAWFKTNIGADVSFDLPVEYAVERGYTVEMPMLEANPDVVAALTGKTKIETPTGEPTVPEGWELTTQGLMPSGHPAAVQQYINDQVQYFEADYLRRQDDYMTDLADFMREHPEYIPRPEWTQPMTERWNEDWRSVFDPGYLAYQMANNIHTYLAAAASIGITYATGNPMVGTAVAMGLFIPMETQSLIDDLIQSGATYQQAVNWGVPGGIAISSLESAGNIPILKAVAPQFFKGFNAAVRTSLVRQILKYGIATPLKIGASETFEEALQEMSHNAIVHVVDSRRGILDNVLEVSLQAFLATAPLAFLGGGGEYLNMQRFLPEQVQQEILKDVYLFEEQGYTARQAHIMAWNKLVSTDEGIAAVEGAIEAKDKFVPHTTFDKWPGERASGMTFEEWQATAENTSEEFFMRAGNQQNKIELMNKEVSELEDDIVRLENRLSKADNREQRNTIEQMIQAKRDMIADLKRQIDDLIPASQENIRKAKQLEKEGAVKPKEPAQPDMGDEFSENVWDNMLPADKIDVVTKAGLSMKVARKAASEVTKAERRAIIAYLKGLAIKRGAIAKEAVPPPPTTGVERWYEDLTDDQVEGKFGDEALNVMGEALDYNELPDKVKKAVRKEYREVYGEEAVEQPPEEIQPAEEEHSFEYARTDLLERWIGLPKKQRVALAQMAGLTEGQVGQKRISQLTSDEVDALARIWQEMGLKFEEEAPVEEVKEERPSEGTPMPESEIQRNKVKADALLDQTARAPYTLYPVGIPEGEAYIKTDGEGKPFLLVELHTREDTKKLTLDLLVSFNKRMKIATANALKEVMKVLEPRIASGEIAFAPRIEMSPDAIRIFDKYMAKKKPIAPEEPVTAGTRRTIRIFNVDYIGMETGEIAAIRRELNKFKVNLVRRIKSIRAAKPNEAPGITPDGKMRLATYHMQDMDAQVPHELGHILYQDVEAELQTTFREDIRKAERFTYKDLNELFAEAVEEYVTGRPMDVSWVSEEVRGTPYRQTHPELLDKVIDWLGERDLLFRVADEVEDAKMGSVDESTEESVMPEPVFEDSMTGSDFDESPVTRLPRQSDFFLELEKIRHQVRANTAIQESLYTNKNVSRFMEQARNTWERANNEQRREILKRNKLAKSFAQDNWDGLSEVARLTLILDAIPNGSLHFRMIRSLADVAEFCEFLEEATGQPFTMSYFRADSAKALADAVAAETEKQFVQVPGFLEIIKDSKQLAIVQQELNARDPVSGVEHPDNITDKQLEMVDAIQYIYDMYKPYARYLAFMREAPNIEALKTRFVDAVKEGRVAELEEALRLRKRADFDGLWNFLKGCDWGVKETGYDPRQVDQPDLVTRDVSMGYVRGEGSLNRRTRVEFPEGKLRRDVFTRMIAYINQMEIQWNIEPELNTFEKLWKSVYYKFDNRNQIKGELDAWWGRMQGIPSKYGWFTRQLLRLRRQAFAAVFIEPVLSLRNSFQPLLMHYDKSELVRYIVEKKSLPTSFRLRSTRYYEIKVSQLAGLRRDWLQMGAAGLPGFGKVNALFDKLNMYGWSDYFPRMWSFLAYTNKAYRATQQYLKDGNVKKWIKNSGAIHMRHTEVNHVLSTYLADPDALFDTQIDGIENMTGAEAAIWFVAQRNTDRTHFRYRREQRSTLEQGAAGDILYSLFVFPRGYGLRVAWQAEKMKGLFTGEATWQEARSGFNDLLKLFIVAQIFSSFWRGLTGRERNPYDPFSILTQWTFGGLAVGVVTDFITFLNDLSTAANPVNDEETRRSAISRLPREFKRLMETNVPFYKRAIDIWASIVDTSDPDMYWFRQLLTKFYEDYTPEELEKLDMETWEQWRKAILGAEPEDPTIFEKLQDGLQENRDMLGTMGADGRFYTLRDYGNRVASLTKGMPDIFISDYVGSHPLDIFYKDCEAQWEEYYTLPTTPSSVRRNWREAHPEEEAMMLFWGKFSESVYPLGSQQWEQVALTLLFWFNLYKIDQTMHPAWANWGLDLTK